MKKNVLGAGIALAGLVVATLLPAAPALAATAGNSYALFYSADELFSSVSPNGEQILYSDAAGAVLYLLETASNEVVPVQDPGDVLSYPAGSVFSPDGQTAYVADYSANIIAVVDVASATIVDTLSVPGVGPWPIAMSPDGGTLSIGAWSTSSLVSYDLANETWSSVSGVPFPVNIWWSADDSQLILVGRDGNVMVFDAATTAFEHSWSPVSGTIDGSCINPDHTVLYLPDLYGTTVTAVSLTDGSIVAQNTNLDFVHPTNCAVSPDGSALYITDASVGNSVYQSTTVTSPGVVYQLDPATLATSNLSYSFDGVAQTGFMNFFNACTAYVSGTGGNAQTFDLGDGCVIPTPTPTPTPTPSPSSTTAALPTTGANGAGSVAIGVLALLSVGLGAALRRRALL